MARHTENLIDPTPALRGTSTSGLLDTIEQLTHRIHAVGAKPWPAADRDEVAGDLRAQRRLVRAEILRRAGA